MNAATHFPALPIDLPPSPAERLRARTRRAFVMIAALVVGLFGLAAILHVGGAVIGPGEIGVASRVKSIVHPNGGILKALYVHDGDRVREGQVLMRFDTQVSGVGADQARESVDGLTARRARLEAERDGRSAIAFPAALLASRDPIVQALIARERRQFDLKRREREGSLAIAGRARPPI